MDVPFNNLLVIDGDYIAFQIASLLEERSVNVYDEQNNFIGNYKNRTTFKNSEECVYDYKTYKVEDSQEVKKDWEDAFPMILRSIVSSLKKKTKTDEVLIVLGGESNFRDRILTPTKYKSNRDSVLRPLILSSIKNSLYKHYNVQRAVDCEADDLIAHYQWLSYVDSSKYIVCATPDKDATQTNCTCLYNPQTEDSMSIEGLGTLVLKEKPKYKLKTTGRMTIYIQMLYGDTVDGYSPCDVYKQVNNIQKVSPMLTDFKVYQILKDCKTDKQCWEKIVSQYKEWYGEEDLTWTAWDGSTQKGNYLDIMQMNWDYCYMLRYPNDKVKVRDILKNLKLL